MYYAVNRLGEVLCSFPLQYVRRDACVAYIFLLFFSLSPSVFFIHRHYLAWHSKNWCLAIVVVGTTAAAYFYIFILTLLPYRAAISKRYP